MSFSDIAPHPSPECKSNPELDKLFQSLFRTAGPSSPGFHEALKQLSEIGKPPISIATRLPCANAHAMADTVCDKPGTMACGPCKLVSYCSKECQKANWNLHKKDCKSYIRSDEWKPSWVLEGRIPHFVVEDEADIFAFLDPSEFNGGCALWGNVPAIDVINLSENEKDATKDFSLAFAASGDLRHVMKTINALPSNFSGNLDILINDGNPFVLCRNIVIILILGLIPDEILAADIALHFWYSAFLPVQYRFQISMLVLPFLERAVIEATKPERNAGVPFSLDGGKSTLYAGCRLNILKECFLHYILSSGISPEAAQSEYNRVRTAYSRRDYRDRIYNDLRPSHRAAFYEYRKVGILLPFGAANAHFNVANASLFSTGGRWLETDFSDPLEGWDIDEVIEGGKKFGARPEDIYGCLYFFLSDQLRTFTHRIRTFPIAFKVLCVEATKLAGYINGGNLVDIGLRSSMRFDRIEVSNIMDPNYAGLRDVLVGWGSLLAKGKYATLVGYFMNWVIEQRDGRVIGAGEVTMEPIIDKMLDRYQTNLEETTRSPIMTSLQSLMFTMCEDLEALYENSKPFSEFLKKQGLPAILKETKLTLRENHKIVPHRLRVPLHASASALPEFEDDEAWYYNTKLKSCTWVERFVEFSRV